jgi:hypothetical protein
MELGAFSISLAVKNLATFTDVRELQHQLKAQGVPLVSEADESTTGPASFLAPRVGGGVTAMTTPRFHRAQDQCQTAPDSRRTQPDG